jgi:methylenetetrahydrofolate reductase (NADPH)
VKIRELFKLGRPVRSFEVFPPKREGELQPLFATIGELKTLQPDFVSVTYGAGGSTRQLTYEIAVELKKMGVEPLVHLTCVGHSREEIAGLLDKLQAAGVENVLALRGDRPASPSTSSGQVPTPVGKDAFRYASELVRFIRKSGYPFCLGVAGYPEKHPDAASRQADLDALKVKCDEGADFITTQMFFDNGLYYRYVDDVRRSGIGLPVLPGIMPVLDHKSLQRFASFGATVPSELSEGFERTGEDLERARDFGLAWATKQCQDLIQQRAPGLHIYAMNKSWPSLRIHGNLRWS